MSGKRAKPSPWRFLRATPVVVVAVVVWVIVGLFFLFPGPGSDQAHEWALDPIPSNSDDEAPSDADPSVAGPSTPTSSAPGAPGSRGPAAPRSAAPDQTPAGGLELTGATAGAPNQPRPRPSLDPDDPATPDSTPDSSPGPPADNPGKKKGHDKPHGPPGRPD